MPDIFLSYNREDQATAQRFAEAFQTQGFSVWWDATLRPGETFDEVTETALRAAKAVVVLWSPRSISSRWVRAEAAIADRNKTLIPVMIEPCERPIMFELTQTADLSHWTGEATDPAWRGFFADVRRFVEATAASKRSGPQPLAQASPPPPSQSARPSLAILPFINRSGEEGDAIFAEDVAEDLTTALSANYWMKVVAASATATYRKGARDLRQIGRDLGARYLLEGKVWRVGDGLRVTAQLVEAEDGRILWTHRFDRPLTDLAVVQEDLVAEVAAHIGMQVMHAEAEHAIGKPEALSSWEALMRALEYSSRATRSGWEAAVAEYKRAVEIDCNDGIAYAQLATAQVAVLSLRGGGDPQLTHEIFDNIRRARALKPDDATVLFCVAAALSNLGEPQDALALAERAVALIPSLPYSHLVLAGVLVKLGRLDEALAELDATARLAPNNSHLDYFSLTIRAAAHLQAGRLDQALEAAERAVRLRLGREGLTHSMLCLAKLNRWGDARNALRRLGDADPEVSSASIETYIRASYGANVVDEYVSIAAKIWDEVATGAQSS
jgi:TolB-like protein